MICGNTNLNEDMIFAAVIAIQLEQKISGLLNLYFRISYYLHSMFHTFHGLRWTQQIGLFQMYGS